MRNVTKKCLAIVVILIGIISYYLYPEQYPIYPKSDHYSPEKQQFFNTTADKPVSAINIAKAFWKMLFYPEKFKPSSALPMLKPDFAQFLKPSSQAQFIWFGHSSLMMRMAEQTVFIDPVFADSVSPLPIMMKRFQDPPARLSELPPVDVIIYSHNHYDHLDEAVVRHYASQKDLQKTRFIVPLAMGKLLQKWGISADRIQELDWWQSVKLGELTITAVPAKHNTARGLFDKNKTLWAGYVFQTAHEKIYYSGDSAFGDGSHFQQIAERFGGFDLAFVENGQYNLDWIDNHMLPEQTAKAVELLNTKRFMPVHWAAYPLSIHRWNEPVLRSIPLVEQIGVKPVTPILGQVFHKESETSYWWEALDNP